MPTGFLLKQTSVQSLQKTMSQPLHSASPFPYFLLPSRKHAVVHPSFGMLDNDLRDPDLSRTRSRGTPCLSPHRAALNAGKRLAQSGAVSFGGGGASAQKRANTK